METREFTAVIEQRDGWFVGYVEELPGVNTQGWSLAELRKNLGEAIRLVLSANRRLSRRRASAAVREKIAVRV